MIGGEGGGGGVDVVVQRGWASLTFWLTSFAWQGDAGLAKQRAVCSLTLKRLFQPIIPFRRSYLFAAFLLGLNVGGCSAFSYPRLMHRIHGEIVHFQPYVHIDLFLDNFYP